MVTGIGMLCLIVFLTSPLPAKFGESLAEVIAAATAGVSEGIRSRTAIPLCQNGRATGRLGSIDPASGPETGGGGRLRGRRLPRRDENGGCGQITKSWWAAG